MNLRRLARLVGIASLVVTVTPARLASALTDENPHVADCDGVLGFVLVPFDLVDPLVPDEFTVRNHAGHAEVFVDTVRCESLILGPRTTHNVEYGALGVGIEPPSQCKGACVRGAQFYLLSWVSDDPSFISWLKDGTGLDGRVRLVKDLVGHRTDITPGTWGWEFDSPSPSPNPFTMAARATAAKAKTDDFAVFWRQTHAGLVQIRTVPKDEVFGNAVGTVTATGEPQTELASVFGTERTRPFAVGLSVDLAAGSYAKAVLR